MPTFEKLKNAITKALWEESEEFLKAFIEEVGISVTAGVNGINGVVIEITDKTNGSHYSFHDLKKAMINSFSYGEKEDVEMLAEGFEELAAMCRKQLEKLP